MILTKKGIGFGKRVETAEELFQAEQTNLARLVHLEYLASTDWYIVRRAETGVEVPQEVLDKRAEARASL